jgi:XrtN system VIT domain protein
MFRTGTHYFDPDFSDSTLVNDAHKAYVVSPVSSLVVLETAQDYEKFNISDNGTSLKNASMKSSGAVPEPHEWLLIVLIAGSVVYLLYKKKKNPVKAG